MIVSKKDKHIHFMMPKTASGTIYKNAKGYLNSHMHAGLKYLKEDFPEVYESLDDTWRITCCIRNPWEHAVSYYFHALDEERYFIENPFRVRGFRDMTREEQVSIDLSFSAFLRKVYIPFYTQGRKLGEFDPLHNLINEFINYNDEKQLIAFLNEFGIHSCMERIHDRRDIKTVVDIPKYYDYRKYYDDQMAGWIFSNCKEEIEIFDYEF